MSRRKRRGGHAQASSLVVAEDKPADRTSPILLTQQLAVLSRAYRVTSAILMLLRNVLTRYKPGKQGCYMVYPVEPN